MSEKSRLYNLCQEAKRYGIKTKPPIAMHSRLCEICDASCLVAQVEIILLGDSRYVEICCVCLAKLIESKKSPMRKCEEKIEKARHVILRLLDDEDPENGSYRDWIEDELDKIKDALEVLINHYESEA